MRTAIKFEITKSRVTYGLPTLNRHALMRHTVVPDSPDHLRYTYEFEERIPQNPCFEIHTKGVILMQQVQQPGCAVVELHPKVMAPNSLFVYHSRIGLLKLTGLHPLAREEFFTEFGFLAKDQRLEGVYIRLELHRVQLQGGSLGCRAGSCWPQELG